MTKEELRVHCEKQVKACEVWAGFRGQEASGKVYEEHKLILDLIKALEQQPSEDCVSREQAKMDVIPNSLYTSEQVMALLDNLSPVTPTFPEDATNGDIMTVMFPDIKIREHEKTDICDAHIQIDIWDFSIYVSKNWWSAPYERGNENEKL